MAVATTDDVSERLGRPLNPEELLTVENLLEDAEWQIVIKGGKAKISDPLWRTAVVSVECDMVLRAARLTAKVTNLVPNFEDYDRDGTPNPQSSYLTPFLTRNNRRTLGMRINGSVSITPAPASDYWGIC